MKTLNLRKEWKGITKEVHNKPKCPTPYPKQVIFTRKLLLLAQVLLEKIGNKENVLLNSELYKKVVAEYYRQKALEALIIHS